MRSVLLSTVLLVGLAATPLIPAASHVVPSATVYAATQQDPQPAVQPPSQSQAPQVVIEEHNTTRTWHPNPMWVAIGGLAVAMLLVLIVMASRGGGSGTTVVRG